MHYTLPEAEKANTDGQLGVTAVPSTLQERFWIFDQLSPATPVHNVAVTIRAGERLSEEALDQALQDLVARHDVLRMHFALVDMLPVLDLVEPARMSLERANASGLQEAARLACDHARLPFNLVNGPLCRVLLVRLPDASVLSLAVHRIVADHRSLTLLITELAELYAVRQACRTPPQATVDAFRGQGDEGRRLASDELLTALQEEFADTQLDIHLPLVKTRPAVPLYRGACHQFWVPLRLVEQASSLAQQEGVAVANVFLAAFQAMLHRYSRHDDVLIGVELDRRSRPDTVGPYADLVPVRSLRKPDANFRDLVRAASRRLDSAAAHSPIPLTLAAEALQQQLGVSEATICRVAFALRPGLPNPRVDGAEWTCELVDVGATEFDLELVLTESATGEDIRAELIYDVELFSCDNIEAMSDHYVRLLESALAESDQHLYLLDMLSPADLDKLLREWNNFPDLRSTDRPIHQLLEQQAVLRPNALAFTRSAEQLTYSELNHRANQLARLLQERGVGMETVVAICIERSWEWLVTVLAAFKSGALPVLLDPQAPSKRHEVALGVNPPLLILSLHRLGLIWSVEPDRIIYVDRDWPEIAKRDGSNLDLPIDLDSLAYLVQTSGSSGVPKSVGVTHRAIVHCAVQKAAVYGITPETRSSWLALPGSGASKIEIWPYLCTGASIHTTEPEVVTSPPVLRDWVVEKRLNHLFIVATLAELLWSLDWPEDCALRLMETGSETVRDWAPKSLPFEVTVDYGAAEASIMASGLQPWERRVTSATASPEERLSPPPMGRPWPGIRVYVLDPDLNLMPPGTVGELCVDSPELARGYLGDPVLTALQFVPNPFSGAPGSRLYRTGDLVCQRDTGLLYYRGRIDTQVKLRGHRVETSEVEAVLLDHPKITEAAVVTALNPEGQYRLAAYLVLQESVSAAELRTFIGDRLPSYMVPSVYIPMTKLPRNFGNKVDRLSLPSPDWNSTQESQLYQAPRDEIEQVLVNLWMEILKVTNTGTNDNFFDLGGDSLSASRVVMRVRERLAAEVNLRDIFLSPTPATLAQRIRGTRNPLRSRELPEVIATCRHMDS